MTTCVLHDRFIDAASDLPKEVAYKVWRAIRQFRRDPHHPGLHYEKLTGKADRYWSIRVDEHYRIVVADGGEIKILMFVGSHQDAYRFVERPVGAAAWAWRSAVSGAVTVGVGALIGGMFQRLPSTNIAEGLPKLPLAPAECSRPLSESVTEKLESYPHAMALVRALRSSSATQRRFALSEIEALLGDTLPIFARISLKWWNDDSRIAAACDIAGWRASGLLRIRAQVVFEKIGT